MYYVIVPLELCEKRRIFLNNPRTRDGRVILTQRDVQPLTFSLGVVELVTDVDMQKMIVPVEVDDTIEEEVETSEDEDNENKEEE